MAYREQPYPSRIAAWLAIAILIASTSTLLAEPPEVDEETVRVLMSDAQMTFDDAKRRAAFESAIPTAEPPPELRELEAEAERLLKELEALEAAEKAPDGR